MIRVTIESLPHGNERRKRLVGTIEIVNDATSSNINTGHYQVTMLDMSGKHGIRKGEVKGFPRTKLGACDLLYRALQSLLEGNHG